MSSRPPRLISLGRVFIVISSLILTSTANPVHAEKLSTEEWNISADKVVRYENPHSIIAKGNVILTKKELIPPKPSKEAIKQSSWAELLEEEVEVPEVTAEEIASKSDPQYKTTVTIKSDWMVYDVELESIKAKGHVQIITDTDNLRASEGTLKLENQTGKFTDAIVTRQQHSLHLEGKSIEKTGFDTYRIEDGWVITCKLKDGETPPWSFSSSETDVQQNGYAFLKHAKFKIKDVPVFYTPYMVIPVKNTRQTGFLFPELSSSSNSGFGVNIPFFLNISESMDATFFPEYLTKRGFMPGVEFRYVEEANNKGMISANYIDDKLSDPSETDYYTDTGYTHTNSERYWVRAKADHTFASSWQSRLDVDIVSDQDFLTEFNSGVTGFKANHNKYLNTFGRGFQNETDDLRENSFKLLRSWSGISLEANLLAINEADDDPDETETPLWELPSVAFTGAVPFGESSLTFDWDADYVNYWREDGVGGHRFDLRPSIATPIPLSPYLESRAEIGVRNTSYSVQSNGESEWEYDDTQNRFLIEGEAEIATTLEKDFFTSGQELRSYSHELRPFIKYGYISDQDQDELPQFDSVDTIDQENSITYGIDNFINTYRYKGESESKVSEYAYFKIEQSYDMSDEYSDEPFSDIYSRLGWAPLAGAKLSYNNYYDVYDNKFNSHTFESEYTNSRGDSFSLDYSKKDSEDIEQINGTIAARIFNQWVASGEIKHSLAQDTTDEAIASLTYHALCWSVKFETRYTEAETTYGVLFKLANIGNSLGFDY